MFAFLFQEKPPDEKRLIALSKKGELEAFDSLVRLHQDRVYNLALRLLGHPEDALDLSQEVFCRAFRKIDSFKGRSAFFTWLYRITVNLAKNYWKKNQSNPLSHGVSLDAPPPGAPDDCPPMQIPGHDPDARSTAASRQMLDILNEKMLDLSPEHRQVLVLRFNENLSLDEIARILDCSTGTVKSRIFRARQILRKKMEPFTPLDCLNTGSGKGRAREES